MPESELLFVDEYDDGVEEIDANVSCCDMKLLSFINRSSISENVL